VTGDTATPYGFKSPFFGMVEAIGVVVLNPAMKVARRWLFLPPSPPPRRREIHFEALAEVDLQKSF
jgi:hypothetical protein